jgi:hypothetical protein
VTFAEGALPYGKNAVVALPIDTHRKYVLTLALAASLLLPTLVAVMFGFAHLTEWLQIDWGPVGMDFPS